MAPRNAPSRVCRSAAGRQCRRRMSRPHLVVGLQPRTPPSRPARPRCPTPRGGRQRWDSVQRLGGWLPSGRSEGGLAGGHSGDEPAPSVYSDGGLLGASAIAAAGASADRSAAGAGMPVSPVVSPAPESAPGVSPDGGPSGVSTGAAAHTARDSVHRDATNPRRGATFLRLSGATSGYATEDAAVIAIRSQGAAAPLPIYCRSTTSCRSPRAAARTCSIYIFSALPITACATAMGRLCRRNAPCSASSALLARRSTRLADGLQVDVAGRDTLRISARRACIFAAASSDPGRGLPSTNLPLPAIGTIANDPLCAPIAHDL